MINIYSKLQGVNFKFQTLLLLNFSFIILVFTFCAGNAYAHKVNIYAYAENGMVQSEGYFADGTKCKNSLIEVFDEKNGVKLLEGKTDEDGKFSFKIPKATSLKLVLNVSMGHKNEYILAEDEVRDAMGQTIQKKEEKNSQIEKVPQKFKKSEQAPPMTDYSGKLSEIETIVEKVTDRKLQPVMRMLVKLQEQSERPGMTEIIGGIGYIIGIMGIIMYFKSRRISK